MSELRTRPLGATGIEVTEIGLGLWAAGGDEWGGTDDTAILEAIDVARDAGVTFFDTADKYGDGHSERVLGQAMEGRRNEFVVATKIGWIGYDHDAGSSQYDSPERVVAGVEDSLQRLGIETLDVIQCHIDRLEANTPNFIEGFRRLKSDGRVRAWGVSTSDFDYLQAFNEGGDCGTLQIDYSILNRTPEQEILPYCAANGIGVIIRGPIAMGLLADKFDADAAFPDGDFRQAWQSDPAQHEQFLADLAVVDRLRPLVPEGSSMAQFALRFVLDHPAVSTVIPGARNARQARANIEAGLQPPLTADQVAEIDAIVPPGGGRRIWPA